jgi:DNA polymerase-3 subunit delta
LAAVASELKPVYLIVGSDRPKVARAVRRLRDRLGIDAAEVTTASETPGEAAVAACNALGLFTDEARLVIVEDVERWRADDAKAIAAYLESPAPSTVLALVGEGVKADSVLTKACKKAGDVLSYDAPKKRDLPRWIAGELKRRGASAGDDVCRALAELVGDDLIALGTEVDKLATWANGRELTVADVERLAVPRAETTLYSLNDAWGNRDVAAVLEAAEAILERSPRELGRIVGSLVGHVGRVRACQALAAEGVRPREAAGRLKMHPWVAEKAFAQAANFSVDELRDAVVRLAALDLAVKGGSRLAPELELSRALVEVTRPRDHAAAT